MKKTKLHQTPHIPSVDHVAGDLLNRSRFNAGWISREDIYAMLAKHSDTLIEQAIALLVSRGAFRQRGKRKLKYKRNDLCIAPGGRIEYEDR